MNRLPVHMRISCLSPSDQEVDSRQKAIKQLAASWGKIKIIREIIAKAADIANSLGGDGTSSTGLSDEVELAVQKHASAFLSTERPLEVGICAGMAALSIMETEPGTHGWTIADLYSNALWLALAFQPALHETKREALRREVLDRAVERSLESANRAREREPIPEIKDLEVTIDDQDNVTTNFKEIIIKIIDPLKRNAALDREELDYIWWAQLNRSRLLNRTLSNIPEATRLVTMGIEGASLLRRLPADVHREIVLRTVDLDQEFDLQELIAAIGEDRSVLAKHIHQTVTSSPTVYPLSNALITGVVSGDGAAEKRTASAWGSRALLEAAMARLSMEGLGHL